MLYAVERTMPYAREDVWAVLADVRHYAHNDPFHRSLRFTGPLRSGVGTSFSLTHAYLPLFPFRQDEVSCIISEWDPPRRQTLLERNRRPYRNHTQRFTLETIDGDAKKTRVDYEIAYRGIPRFLAPWGWWVRRGVERRMDEKLEDIEIMVSLRDIVERYGLLR